MAAHGPLRHPIIGRPGLPTVDWPSSPRKSTRRCNSVVVELGFLAQISNFKFGINLLFKDAPSFFGKELFKSLDFCISTENVK